MTLALRIRETARAEAAALGDRSDTATMNMLASILADMLPSGFLRLPTEPSAGPRRQQPEPVE